MMVNKQRSSTLVMALAIIAAATMLVSTVIVKTLDLFDDAEAKKSKQKSKRSGGEDRRPDRD
jgi:hypothetical protein